MESAQSLVVLHLAQGQELIKKLLALLDEPTRVDSCKSVASEILLSIERAISMAKSNDMGADSSGSPRSENSELAFKDRGRKDVSKKRKTLPKWTKQVMVGTGERLDGPLDDEYSWRKYGQKDILGAKYPRGYYRCTYRNTRGCQAMKQVQRSDQNPSAFDVTYRGAHTCHKNQSLNQNLNLNLNLNQNKNQQPDLLISFQSSLRVRTQLSGSEGSPSLFPSTPQQPENQNLENCFNGGLSPSFISPSTSESNYYSVSPCEMSSFGWGALPAGSSFTGVGSTLLDMDFMLDPVEFDPDFPFDTSTYFS